MQVNRRLNRCRNDRLIAGVASGVAEYFDIDPTIVRVLLVVSVLFGGLGLLLYFVMAIIVPIEPEDGPAVSAPTGDPTGDSPAPTPTDWHSTSAAHRHASRGSGRLVTFFGVALILFGGLALVNAFLPAWVDGGRWLWPAFILGIGAILVASAVRREPTEL
jgi:phage shock protein C